MTDSKVLRQKLKDVAVKLFRVDRDKITRGLVCVAVPIFGIDGQVDTAISCTMSSFDTTSDLLTVVIGRLVGCARAASC